MLEFSRSMEFAIWKYDSLNALRPAYLSLITTPKEARIPQKQMRGSGPLGPLFKGASAAVTGPYDGIPDAIANPVLISQELKKWISDNHFDNGLEFLPVSITDGKKHVLCDRFWLRPIEATDCVDLKASQAQINTINDWSIDKVSGLHLRAKTIAAGVYFVRPQRMEMSILVSMEIVEKLMKTAFTGIAFGRLSDFNGFSGENFYMASSHGGHKLEAPAKSESAVSDVRFKELLARFKKLEGKRFSLKKRVLIPFLDLEATAKVEFEFKSPAALKKSLLAAYSDEIVSLGASDDGASWNNNLIVPLGTITETSAKKEKTRSDVCGWLFYSAASNDYFATTSDRWNLDRSAAKLEDFLEGLVSGD